MTQNKDRLFTELRDLLGNKEDKTAVIPGNLGISSDGSYIVDVPNRPGWVYVRLRGNHSEVVEASNRAVSSIYDLPVLVSRDRFSQSTYTILDRDTGLYSTWPDVAGPQMPNHGSHHSFGSTGTGQDITWIYKRQFLPLLATPSTGSTVYFMPEWYGWGGEYQYFTGTYVDFGGIAPTGGYDALFVTMYLEGETGLIVGETGTIFNIDPWPGSFRDNIPFNSSMYGIPLVAVLISKRNTDINWGELYDVRPIIGGVERSHGIRNAGTDITQRANLNIIGDGLVAYDDGTDTVLSGTHDIYPLYRIPYSDSDGLLTTDGNFTVETSFDALKATGGMIVSSTGSYYLGAPDVNGSWRMIRNGNDLTFERREAGSWVNKSTISA